MTERLLQSMRRHFDQSLIDTRRPFALAQEATGTKRKARNVPGCRRIQV